MDRLQTLFQGYLDHRLSADEFVELFELLAEEAAMNTLTGPLQALWEEQPTYRLSDAHWDERMEAIKETMSEKGSAQPARAEHRGISRRWSWAAAATVTAILVSSGAYWYIHRQHTPTIAAVSVKQDVAPGGRHATLTLSNGEKIFLDSAKNGTLAMQGSFIVNKTDSALVYESAKAQDGSAGWNTLSTPDGGDYKLVLPDGTRCWLNAGSSIRFPTDYSGKYRDVDITGEAYFEVVHRGRQPFRVHAGGQMIEDIGTVFNVNAYEDEGAVRTTLLDGSISIVTPFTKPFVLRPGEQASFYSNQSGSSTSPRISVTKDVDIEEVLAWRHEMFDFKGTDLPSIMRQVSRWYDVSIQYEGNLPPDHFHAYISRARNVSNLLQILEQTGRVHFRIEKDKVLVIGN